MADVTLKEVLLLEQLQECEAENERLKAELNDLRAAYYEQSLVIENAYESSAEYWTYPDQTLIKPLSGNPFGLASDGAEKRKVRLVEVD